MIKKQNFNNVNRVDCGWERAEWPSSTFGDVFNTAWREWSNPFLCQDVINDSGDVLEVHVHGARMLVVNMANIGMLQPAHDEHPSHQSVCNADLTTAAPGH